MNKELLKHHMLSAEKRNVFISYAWEDEKHQQWVKSLAKEIENAGGNPLLDQQLNFGGNLRIFMDMNIKAADVVLMIMTPKYKQKAEIYNGGVGYEYNIITKDLFKNIHQNEKYIGVLRTGDHESSVPEFLDSFKYVDLRDGNDFQTNMTQLLGQILEAPLKHPEHTSKSENMDVNYINLPSLIVNMTAKASEYFHQIIAGVSQASKKESAAAFLESWTEEVKDYSESFRKIFNPQKMQLYRRYKEDFKTKTFRNNLWTVKAALRTPDPDLAAYKANFRDSDEEEIYSTVDGILNATHQYVQNIATGLDYFLVKDKEELQIGYLDQEDMFMRQIIGFGIRSEILHRYYPHHFPVMTQQSLWAMYFICENANEFIRIEQKIRAGQMRVSHNWQYPYDRFTFLMNVLANQLHGWFEEFGLHWDEQYRFGYVNLFLAHIHTVHKADIKLLHEWA